VEVSEDAASADLNQAQRFIGSLHGMGTRICLTGFGSGFASFACLRHLEVDLVQIDEAFMRRLPADPHNRACVKAIVDLAHALGRTAMASGVEDAATHRVLEDLGVDYVQGYHFDRPTASHPALKPDTAH
jgi:EAL domain-containing protein (putative c-di-GMP-specific phosphodiesterase class I)